MLLEQHRNLLEQAKIPEVRELRKTYNADLFSSAVLDVVAFSSNSPESHKKKQEVLLIRQLNEQYLVGELKIDSAEAKSFLELDGGMRVEGAVSSLSKSILDIIMPGTTGNTAIAEFRTGRSKRE